MRDLRRSILLPLLLLALPGSAQSQDGFLFQAPRGSISARVLHAAPRAQGDVYDLMTGELTLERGDFAALGFSIDASLHFHERFAGVLSIARTQSSTRSEFRGFVDEQDRPIEQSTRLLRVPVTLALRWYPLAPGRALAEHAWVPRRVAPFLTAGGGVVWYRLTQEGDFVDYETLDIFRDDIRSSGSSVLGQVGGGAELWVTSRAGAVVEGRYGWAAAPLRRDFDQFEDIDLRGWQAAAGLVFRF